MILSKLAPGFVFSGIFVFFAHKMYSRSFEKLRFYPEIALDFNIVHHFDGQGFHICNVYILIIITHLIAFIFVHTFTFLILNLQDEHIGVCTYSEENR